MPADIAKDGTFYAYYLANSSANVFKFENGLSKTNPAILGSLSACISAATAPIDLPHKPIVET